jgi:peptidoglycan-associated lipoprotein
MERRSVTLSLALALSVLALGALACQSTGSGSDAEAGGQAYGTGTEFSEEQLGSSQQGESGTRLSLSPVYFDVDRYDIRDDAKSVLRSNARTIETTAAGQKVVIEGHCDERGSDEYNLALGERRANAVMRYLVNLGIPSSQLTTVSFGEARPAAMGHDEMAYRLNRRSELRVGGTSPARISSAR